MNKIFLANISNLNSVSEVFLFTHLLSTRQTALPPNLSATTVPRLTIIKTSPSPSPGPLMCAVLGLPPFLRERLFIIDNFPELNTDLILDYIGIIAIFVRCDAGLVDKFRSSHNY